MPLSVLRGERDPGSKFLIRDSLLAQALTLYEKSLHACGHPVWESADPANNADNWDRTGYYEAPVPLRCYACTVIAAKVKDYEKVDDLHSLLFHAERRDAIHPARWQQ